MAPSRNARITLVLANAVGIGIFMLITSQLFWIEPELANEPGAKGGAAFGWIVMAAPIGVFFVVADLWWLSVELRGGGRRSPVAAIGLTTVLVLSWVVSYAVDNMHHGI